jgi:hypothetical protein
VVFPRTAGAHFLILSQACLRPEGSHAHRHATCHQFNNGDLDVVTVSFRWSILRKVR